MNTDLFNLGVSRTHFMKEIFERKFLLSRSALGFAKEFTWANLNAALFSWDPSDGLIKLFQDGPIPVHRYTEQFSDLGLRRTKIVKSSFYDYLRNGATLVLNRLDTKSEAVNDLTLEISRFVGEKAVSNGYAAFGGRGTFGKHWDTHDVFAIQLIGRKHWRVFEPTFALPLLHQISKERKHECPSTPEFEGILEAGDVLYIPRGWWHEAIPIDGQETFHLAVGIHPRTIVDFVAWSCVNALSNFAEFRPSVCMGNTDAMGMKNLLHSAAEIMASEEVLEKFKESVISNERISTAFCLEQLGGNELPQVYDYRLNSAYGRHMSGSPVQINGSEFSMDSRSRAALEFLFLSPDSSKTDSQFLAPKLVELLKTLADQDIVSRVRRAD